METYQTDAPAPHPDRPARSPRVEELPELVHLWLEVTQACNLSCTHCYNESGPGHHARGAMALADWVRILVEARDAGCASVQIIGGEPLLHPDLLPILRKAHELDYEHIEVFTNATCLTADWVTAFGYLGVSVATSFYAADAGTHESITGKHGSFGKTLDGIRLALRHRLDLRVGLIQVTQTDAEVELARSLLEGLGVTNIGRDSARAIGRAAATDGAPSTHDDEAPLRPLCGGCGEGRLCVTSSGAIYPCIMARRWEVGCRESGVVAATKGAPLREFLTRLRAAKAHDAAHQDCDPNANCNPRKCAPGTICYPNCQPI